MKNLVLRTITGVLFVALTVFCLVHSLVSCIVFSLIVAVLGNWEFSYNYDRHGYLSTMRFANPVGAFILFLVILMSQSLLAPGMNLTFAFIPYIFLLVAMMVKVIMTYDEDSESDSIVDLSVSVFSHIYTAGPFALLCILGMTGAECGEGYSYVLPLSVFIFLWTNDTGAYCTGSLLHSYFPKKMSPRVSPNKTWVGTIGGGVLCLVAACILWHFFATYSLPVWLGFAVVVSFFGTLGDLFESTFKRCLNIKDSGKILPGHGGILDRFDSAMMAVPATYVYFMVVDIVNSL